MTNITKIKNAIKRKVNESRVRNTVSSPLQNKVYDAVTGMSVNGKDSFESKFAVRSGKLNDFVFKLSDRDATGILKLIKQRKFESIKELDVRKTHGDKRIENPATGNDIKLRTALKAKKGSAVYAKGKSMYNALKDKPANESVSKLTEAEDYKYKKYVAKAFKDILGAQFDFRHAMGVKQLTNKDMKLKKKADAIYKAIIDLQKDMKSKGLTENKLLK